MDIVLNTKKNLSPLNSGERDSGATPDLLTQLERLGELKEKGFLTEGEFNTQKSKLLG
ncbi:SHOCT domain-containing protein [Erwinia tracheiphila]|uniref:SHOCT domain-containing protein n=1 Tax=Erwinia tracheiphila TaxID=65700 RepID=UPI001E55A9EB|nr:SHOCT domain-containing protein [Erwinia tracheiphila]UIA87298.1 SHOCT domain-containing protein [Erwinia tracheiphila]UIA95661.1 SHOCT domain-containing protein [Erwinia tracheiphila]